MAETATCEAHPHLRVAAPFVPYAAVAVGMYWMSSGWVSILLYHAGMVTILSVTKSWAFPRMAQGRMCRRVLVFMAAGAALVGPLVYAVWSSVQVEDITLAGRLGDFGLIDLPWVGFIVYYFTVNPLLEETYWRGYLGSNSKSLGLNDGLFAGYHLLVVPFFVSPAWVAASFVALLGAAWLWRQAARLCQGLLIPVVTHAMADASLILAAFFLAR